MVVREAGNAPGARGALSRGEGKASPAERTPGDTAGTGSVDEAQVVELRFGVCQGDGWLYEVKFDGYRIQVNKAAVRITLSRAAVRTGRIASPSGRGTCVVCPAFNCESPFFLGLNAQRASKRCAQTPPLPAEARSSDPSFRKLAAHGRSTQLGHRGTQIASSGRQ